MNMLHSKKCTRLYSSKIMTLLSLNVTSLTFPYNIIVIRSCLCGVLHVSCHPMCTSKVSLYTLYSGFQFCCTLTPVCGFREWWMFLDKCIASVC